MMKIVPASVDQKLLFMLMALIGIGLVLVFSASSVASLEQHQDKFFLVKRQAKAVLVGLVVMLCFLSMDYHRLRSLSIPGLIATFLLLILVLIPGVGRTVNGATRWIVVWGSYQIQPGEIAKLALILYLADFLAEKYRKRESFRDYVLPNLALLGLIGFLIVKQRSLSSAVLVTATGFLMIVVAHANLGHILSLCAAGALCAGGLVYMEPYRIRRLIAFADPWSDPAGAGYQIIQSLMAMGSGGLSGVGVGQGLQKLKAVPFVSTDFIFAVVGEEVGFMGSLVIVALFLGILWRGLGIALRAPDLFGMLLAFGITVSIVGQALLNMAVVTGLMPTTGIPLPFLSYGGSSMVVTLAAVGILLSISRAIDGVWGQAPRYDMDGLPRTARRWNQA